MASAADPSAFRTAVLPADDWMNGGISFPRKEFILRLELKKIQCYILVNRLQVYKLHMKEKNLTSEQR